MTVTKFSPTYTLTVYSNFSTVTVTYPITCKFTVVRDVLSDSTRATIQLYNLAPNTRNEIKQDIFVLDPAKFKYVHLSAGYGDSENAPLIFKGRILQAYSHRAGGSPDIITQIEAQALDIFDCQTSHTFAAGTSYMDIHNTIAADMPNVTIGNVGGLKGTIQTDLTVDGNAFEELNKLTNGHTFIDNGVLNTIMNNEVIDVPVPVITDDNGLLETPMRRDANLEVRMLFEPNLIIGQLLEIQSSVSPDFNGQYKVLGFTHDCLISGSQAGERITTVNLWIGPLLPGALTALQNGQIDSNFNKVRGFDISSVNPSKPGKWTKPVNGVVTSNFGFRAKPSKEASTNHKGIDIAVPVGTPIKAPADGNIVAAKSMSGYGYSIWIYHGIINGKSVQSRYAHLSRFAVSQGQNVKQNQIIGYTGGAPGSVGAGTSTGPHLHFEVRENGTPVNPIKYIGTY